MVVFPISGVLLESRVIVLTIVIWGSLIVPLVASTPKGWALREALERLDKDLYDNAPSPERPYISSLRNPCWAAGGGGGDGTGGEPLSTAKGAVRCLPYALVLGGFQCGAASLFAALYKHPLVLKTGVSRWHFWAEFDKTMGGYLAGLEGGAARIAAWRAHAQPALLAAGSAGSAAGGVVVVVGGGAGAGGGGAGAVNASWLSTQQPVLLDGSSSTFAFYWSPGMRAHRAFTAAMSPCWKACHADHKAGPGREECLEGRCYPAARQADRKVAAALGLPYADVSLPLLVSAVYGSRPPKMVVLLRNPVDRLYSAFWKYGHYQDKYGKSAEGFAAYVREQLGLLRSCMARNASATPGGLDPDMRLGCLLGFETWGLAEERLFFHADQILRGVYAIYLERWFRFFDRPQLLVLRSEDYFARPVQMYDAVLRFLDLDPEAISQRGRIERIERILTKVVAGSGGGAAATAAALKAALEAPAGDERLWTDIRRLLTFDIHGRYAANRAAARSALRGAKAAEEAEEAEGGPWRRRRLQAAGAAAGGRPPMPADVRRELAEFYDPYNRRLAELLGDPEFIRGWG